MFDTSEDGDPLRDGTTEKGGNLNRGEKTFDKIKEPLREVNLDQDMGNPIMIDGVKGFSGVEEKKEPIRLFPDRLVEELIDVDSMVTTVFTR